MKLLNLYYLFSLSIFIVPILIGVAYCILTKDLPENDFSINYDEF